MTLTTRILNHLSNQNPRVTASQTNRLLEEASVKIRQLESWIAEEGVRTDTCTYPILGELCQGCRCSRSNNPSPFDSGII